jgi:hypothetical protein
VNLQVAECWQAHLSRSILLAFARGRLDASELHDEVNAADHDQRAQGEKEHGLSHPASRSGMRRLPAAVAGMRPLPTRTRYSNRRQLVLPSLTG